MHAHLPYTPWQTQTKRGYHLWYRWPGVHIWNRVRLDTGDGRIALDVRGDGGYVIAPGSVHKRGLTYTYAGDWSVPRQCLPYLPLAALRSPTPINTPRPMVRPTGNIIDRARRYLAAIPPPEIGRGSDAATLYAACRLVRGFALDAGDATALLWDWAGGRDGWTLDWGRTEGQSRAPLWPRAGGGAPMTTGHTPDAWDGAETVIDECACPTCGRESCEDPTHWANASPIQPEATCELPAAEGAHPDSGAVMAFTIATPPTSFVTRFISHLVQRTDASPVVFELMAVGILSALASHPRIPLATSTRGLSLVLWLCFIVDSTVGRKSTVLDFARELLVAILGTDGQRESPRASEPAPPYSPSSPLTGH